MGKAIIVNIKDYIDDHHPKRAGSEVTVKHFSPILLIFI